MLHAVLLLCIVWLCLTHTDIHRTVPSCVWRWQRALRHTYPDWVGAVEVGAGRALESSLRGDGIRADWFFIREAFAGTNVSPCSSTVKHVNHSRSTPMYKPVVARLRFRVCPVFYLC